MIAFHDRTVSPFTRTMRSPNLRVPSVSVPGGSVRVVTDSIWVLASSGAPTVAAIPANTQYANTIFIVTPARITIVRFHTGCRSKARAGSMGTLAFPPSRLPATPSSSSPAIFT